jgi:DNA-binding response OmpR family regulator
MAESPPDVAIGACFVSNQLQKHLPGKLPMGRTRSELVLICDDEPLLTELLEHRLGQHGYLTAVTRDGAEALSFLETKAPDAVIMEMMLAGHDGTELLRHIRASDRLKNMPVIVLSARKQDRDIVETLKLGANEYVTKPFILDELVARLERLLGNAGG